MAEKHVNFVLTASDKTAAAFSSARRSIDGINTAATGLNRVLSLALPALGSLGLASFAKQGIDAADAMNDMSLRTGVAVKTLAEYKLAADQNGTSVEAMAKGIQKLTLSMGQAEDGSNEQAQALKDLGVSARDPQKAFEQLADSVANSNDPIKTNADLQKVLGKNYAELLPLLQGGAQGLRDSAAASQTFAEQMAKLAPDADKFNDNLATLKTNAAGAAASLLNDLVPAMNRVFDRFSELGRLRNSGASLFELITGKFSADSKRSLDSVQKDIADLEARRQRLGTASDPAIETELARLKQVRAELIGIATDKAMAINAPPGGNRPAVSSGTSDFSKAFKSTGKAAKSQGPIDVFDTDRIVAEFDLQRDNQINDIAQSWEEAGRALKDSMATPIEKANIEMGRLDEMLARGVIDWETYSRATFDTFDKLNPKIKETDEFAKQIGLTFSSAFEDAVVSGKKFSDVLKGLAQDISRLVLRKAVTEPLANSVGNWAANLFPSANGNVFANAPALSAYSGTVQTSPFVFPFANGGAFNMGIGAEAGPEGIFPLKRGRDGKLGISAEGAGGVVVQNYYNIDARGADAGVEERIRRALKETERRAVDSSVAQVQDLNRRGALVLA